MLLYTLDAGFRVFALDRLGKRFAGYETRQSGLRAWRCGFENSFGDDAFGCDRENQAAVTVFSAQDGGKIFQYEWKVDEQQEQRTYGGQPFLEYNHLIALNDDGSLLALVKGTELLVFQLPPDHK